MLTASAAAVTAGSDDAWLSVERAGRRLTFVSASGSGDYAARLRAAHPDAEQIEVRHASLREIFVAIARTPAPAEVAA